MPSLASLGRSRDRLQPAESFRAADLRTGGPAVAAATLVALVALAAVLAAATVGAAPAPPPPTADQATQAAEATEPAPAPEPDILSYDLRPAPDLAARRLRLRATLTVSGLTAEQPLELGLADWYEDVRVSAGNSPVRVERAPGAIAITVERPRPVTTVTFELAGQPGRSDGEPRSVIGDHDLFLLWSDRWYPIAFDDWAPVRTEVELPPDWQAVAPGRLVRTRGSGALQTQIFETSIPTRTFSVFADRRWVRAEREVGGIAMVTLLDPASEKYREQIFTGSADVLSFYRELHGDYPFDRFAFVTLDSTYARRAFPGWVGYSPRYLRQEMERTGHDAHETALLWWGLTTGGRGPGAWQWTEGLGDYVEILYDQARGLPIPAIFERFRDEYLAAPPAEEPAITELRGNTPQKWIHGRYPWVMGVLHDVIGDEAFRAAIRHLFAEYRWRTFTLDEMVAALAEGAGRDLSWWRDEWLLRKGVPELTARWEAVAPGGAGGSAGWRVSGRVRQTGTVYHLPLEIAVETAAGRTVARVPLEGPETAFELDVPGKPARVVLDPERRLLARIQQPAAAR